MAAGARVVVNDVDRAAVDEAVAALRASGGEAAGHAGDVSTAAGADGLLATALDTWGRLDVVVNNAGIARDRMLVNLPEDDWDAVVLGPPQGHVPGHPAGGPALARAVQGRRAGRRPGGQHRVVGRALRPRRPVELRRRQGGDRAVHHHRQPGARPLRRHRQRPLPDRADAHDRGGRARRHRGRPRRRPRPPVGVARPRLARLAPVGRRHRPRDRRLRQAPRGGRGLAAGADGTPGRGRGRRRRGHPPLLDAADPNADVQGDISR